MEENKSLSPMQRYNRYITNPATQDYLQSVLNENKADFVSSLTSLVGSNLKLQECVPSSVMYTAIKATALGLPLDPNLGFAYVIPYRDNKAGLTLAQFQVGWKGLLQLAIRTQLYKNINVSCVYEGETIEENRKTGEINISGKKESDNTIGYLAYFQMTNGFEKTIYWTKEQVEAHARRYSKSVTSGPWKTDFDAMAKKTVLKALLKNYGAMSTTIQNAIKYDQIVVDKDGKESYADNPIKEDEQAQNEKAAAIFADAMGVTDVDFQPVEEDKENIVNELFD